MPTTCVCPKPYCREAGCLLDRNAVPVDPPGMTVPPSNSDVLMPLLPGVPFLTAPLTEEDVRRIVREEIANAMSSGVRP